MRQSSKNLCIGLKAQSINYKPKAQGSKSLMKDARFQHKTVIKAMCNAIANVQNLKSKVLSKPNSACTLQSGYSGQQQTPKLGAI